MGGVLYCAESKDGGKTWPELPPKQNSQSLKAPLYHWAVMTSQLLPQSEIHTEQPPPTLALGIQFDGMKTWPYQRDVVPELSDGAQGQA